MADGKDYIIKTVPNSVYIYLFIYLLSKSSMKVQRIDVDAFITWKLYSSLHSLFIAHAVYKRIEEQCKINNR